MKGKVTGWSQSQQNGIIEDEKGTRRTFCGNDIVADAIGRRFVALSEIVEFEPVQRIIATGAINVAAFIQPSSRQPIIVDLKEYREVCVVSCVNENKRHTYIKREIGGDLFYIGVEFNVGDMVSCGVQPPYGRSGNQQMRAWRAFDVRLVQSAGQ